MQKNSKPIEDHSITEMNDLINSIKKRENINDDKMLAVKLGYRQGYISECRSNNKASDKFLSRLRTHLKSLENPTHPQGVGNKKADPDSNLAALIHNNTKLADAIYDAVQMLKKRDEALEVIQASLNRMPHDMISLTAKVEDSQQKILTIVERLAAGNVHSNKSSPRVKS